MLNNQHNVTLMGTTRLSSIYVNLFTHKMLVIKNITSLISNKETVSLVVFSDKNTFHSGLEYIEINEIFQKKIKSLYFINKKSTHNTNIIKLAKDIRFLKLKNKTKLILLISDSYLASLEKKDITIFFKLLNNIAHTKNLTIQLCLYGSLVQSLLKPILITMSHLLAGLTSTTTIDEQQSHVFVDYWANQFGVESNQQYRLSQTEDYQWLMISLIQEQTVNPLAAYSNSYQLYISNTALEPNTITPKGTFLSKNNQTLLDIDDIPKTATIILSCDSQQEIYQLAMDCYNLRQKSGYLLKIVIREMAQCLRYGDEQFLLQAGVNLVVPFPMLYLRFMSQVEAIQGQQLIRTLPSSFDKLQHNKQPLLNKGYLQNQEFIDYSHSIMTHSSQSHISFALIKLTLLQNMSPKECLRLCCIRRNGDVVTASQHAIYVLLSIIDHNNINIALNHIFEFSVWDLFHSIIVLESHLDIENELQTILQNQITIDDDISRLTTEKQIFESESTIQLEPSTLRFAIKKPLKIKE
ncbi:cellulose biosynthesis protein BcsE [Photobacterium toruni]|uniref:cellulose biosynthesis protein BcsE n=1 Tax=Photobacterium toruni TaxID=1935446 RepID=UPI0021108454|nr:cellulose biosynthesis protein BcsE [Photobacterium toruni]